MTETGSQDSPGRGPHLGPSFEVVSSGGHVLAASRRPSQPQVGVRGRQTFWTIALALDASQHLSPPGVGHLVVFFLRCLRRCSLNPCGVRCPSAWMV